MYQDPILTSKSHDKSFSAYTVRYKVLCDGFVPLTPTYCFYYYYSIPAALFLHLNKVSDRKQITHVRKQNLLLSCICLDYRLFGLSRDSISESISGNTLLVCSKKLKEFNIRARHKLDNSCLQFQKPLPCFSCICFKFVGNKLQISYCL